MGKGGFVQKGKVEDDTESMGRMEMVIRREEQNGRSGIRLLYGYFSPFFFFLHFLLVLLSVLIQHQIMLYGGSFSFSIKKGWMHEEHG